MQHEFQEIKKPNFHQEFCLRPSSKEMTFPKEEAFRSDKLLCKVLLHFTAFADFERVNQPKMKKKQTPLFLKEKPFSYGIAVVSALDIFKLKK